MTDNFLTLVVAEPGMDGQLQISRILPGLRVVQVLSGARPGVTLSMRYLDLLMLKGAAIELIEALDGLEDKATP